MSTDSPTDNTRPRHPWRTVFACLGAAAAVGAIGITAATATGDNQDRAPAATSAHPDSGPAASPHASPSPNPHPNPNGSPRGDASHEPVTYAPVRGTHHTWGNAGGPGLSPQEVNNRVVNGLRAPGRVKAVKVSRGSGASTITVLLNHYVDSIPEVWNAELAVGAAAQLSATTETSYGEVVSSAIVTGPNDGGVETSLDLGTGPVALNQAFDSPSDADLAAHAHEVAKQFGLTVSAVQILHPLDSALDVTFTVPDDAKIDWTVDQLSDALVGATPDVEGVFIQLNNAEGTPLLQASSAYRTGAGGLWFAPGQDGRFGATHGGMPLE